MFEIQFAFLYLICLFHSIYPELTHNKHFIRHNMPQNKVPIIPNSPTFLPRQTPRLKLEGLRLNTAPHTPRMSS